MSDTPERPSINIRFRFNVETGEIEDLIIDDNAPLMPEDYHDAIAALIAQRLGRNPDVEDAGSRHAVDEVWLASAPEETQQKKEEDQDVQPD